TPGIRLYALGILLVLLAWLGTYKNKSMLLSPDLPALVSNLPARVKAASERSRRVRVPAWTLTAFRYLLAFSALALNIYVVWFHLRTNYFSPIGGYGWLASLILLFVAFIGYRPKMGSDADAGVQDVEDRTDLRLSKWVEVAVVLGLFALCLGLRLWRLDDWTTGMHGDEGEAGMDATA